MKLAFVDANLTRNPFGEPTREEREAMALLRVPVPAPGEKVQLIGIAGAGKTTALQALRKAMPDSVLVYCPADEKVTLPQGSGPLLVDEAQRQPRRALRSLFSSARTVVVSTHEDLSSLARDLRTIRFDRPELALLDAIITQRLEWARRAPGDVPRPPPALLEQLLAEHGVSLRAIEHALYRWYLQWG